MNWNELNIDEMSVGELWIALTYVTDNVPRVSLYNPRSEDIFTIGDVNDDDFYLSQWEVENRLAQIQTRLRYLLRNQL